MLLSKKSLERVSPPSRVGDQHQTTITEIMPAPEIPNLKSLLANRRGGQQRGRGRGPIAGGTKHESSDAAKDLVVQNTDQDAATSRLSCIELGYLEDAFAKAFATQPTIRRLPLLNRGKLVEHR